VKSLASITQQSLLVLGGFVVLRGKPVYDGYSFVLGITEHFAAFLYVSLFVVTILQPPRNTCVVECVLVMVTIGFVMIFLAYVTALLVVILCAIVWATGNITVVIAAKDKRVNATR
jgi:energy-converting hydrogenase Eha subunit E